MYQKYELIRNNKNNYFLYQIFNRQLNWINLRLVRYTTLSALKPAVII